MKKIELNNNKNTIKLRIEKNWNILFLNKEILFEYLTKFLLDKHNIFYYASQKSSTTTLDETKKYIERLIKLNILDQEISSVLNSIGWNSKEIDIRSTIFQGDLAEYLMCIIIDSFFTVQTIISKVSLKTSPKMPSYGNDNIFYDYENKVLYFGESKFYSNTIDAIKSAYSSLENHDGIKEVYFIKSHTNSIISMNYKKRIEITEELEVVSADDIKIQHIAFIVEDDIHEKSELEKLVQENITIKYPKEKVEKILFVFLPIISKDEFLFYFKERLKME